MSGLVLPSNWHKSTFSPANDCVETAYNAEVGLVRDTINPNGGTIRLPRAGFDAFVESAKLTA